jgi:polyisoprenoid-binding protein YceI
MNEPTTLSLPLRPGVWEIDPLHSSVTFAIRHLGISKVRGRFANFDVSLVVGDDLDTTELTATIDVASIDTANADRDAHVLSPDLLDVTRRPTLAFRSTRLEGDGDAWVLHGDLTIGEVTRPVTLDVELGGLETYPIDGSRHAGFEARGEIRRKDFGIDFGLVDAALGQVVKIEIDLQLVEPR